MLMLHPGFYAPPLKRTLMFTPIKGGLALRTTGPALALSRPGLDVRGVPDAAIFQDHDRS